MKTTLSTFIGIIAIIPILISQPNYTQNTIPPVSDYEDDHLLVYFKKGTSQKLINKILLEFEATEEWISPLSNARYWHVPINNQQIDFGDEILVVDDILDALEGISRRSDEDDTNEGNGGTGLSYIGGRVVIASTGQSADCYEDVRVGFPLGNSKVETSICDSGYNPSVILNQGNSFNPVIESTLDLDEPSNNAIDQNGHGMHILSLVENTSYSASVGTLKHVSHHIVRMLNSDSKGNLANLIYAVEESIVNGAQIINLSLGFMSASPENGFLTRMFDIVKDQNVLTVVAAGNEGINVDVVKEYMPASFNNSNIVTVASIDCRYNLSDFSNYGYQTVDIAAPGEDRSGYDHQGSIVLKSGTSQATAIVSGVASILATYQPVFNARAIKCALLAGATYKAPLAGKVRSSGVVDINGSLIYLTNNGSDQCEPISIPQEDEIPLYSEINDDLKNIGINQDLTISPNPFHHNITVSNIIDFESLHIYNAQGKKLKTITNADQHKASMLNINLENYDSGLYIFHVKTTSESRNFKIIKQ